MQESICTSIRKNSNKLSASTDAPIDQVLLHEQIGDQRLLLMFAKLVVQRLDNLLPNILIIAGADGLADILCDLVADPEFRSRFCPIEKPIKIDSNFVRHRRGLTQFDQIDFVAERLGPVQIEMFRRDQLGNIIALPSRRRGDFIDEVGGIRLGRPLE